MLRNVIFAILFSATFLPNLEIIDCFLKFNVSAYRKIAVSLAMGTVFMVVHQLMPFNFVRFLIQMSFYYIALYIFLGLGFKRTFHTVVFMTAISASTEYVLVKMLESTLIGFEQLIMIDAFYGLTLILDVTILSAIAFAVKQIMKHKEYRKKTKEASESI